MNSTNIFHSPIKEVESTEIKTVHVNVIKEVIATLSAKANCEIPSDITFACKMGLKEETEELPKYILNTILENGEIAKLENMPICQDTGMAVVFIEVGQNIHLIGGDLETAINEGVAKGYTENYLRKSVVKDPINRINTNDNTPAVIHTKIVSGNNIKITLAPKGFGSENMSRVYMLKPSEGIDGVINSVIQTVKEAGSNPCPPIIVGVGVGGTMEKAALLSKEALLLPVGIRNNDPFWRKVEIDLINELNKLDIGPGGFGGYTTALDVHIKTYGTHIAGLPVAVNIGCHVTRHMEFTI